MLGAFFCNRASSKKAAVQGYTVLVIPNESDDWMLSLCVFQVSWLFASLAVRVQKPAWLTSLSFALRLLCLAEAKQMQRAAAVTKPGAHGLTGRGEGMGRGGVPWALALPADLHGDHGPPNSPGCSKDFFGGAESILPPGSLNTNTLKKVVAK